MTQPDQRITCPHCQAANFPSSEICWRCGRTLQGQAQQTPTPLQGQPEPSQPSGPSFEQPPRPADMTTLVVIGFVLAAFSILCCFPLGIVSVILGAIAYAKGDGRGIWVIAAGVIGTIIGAVLLGLIASLARELPTRAPWPGI